MPRTTADLTTPALIVEADERPFVIPLDRIVMYVTIHPYYNELWGQFTLPFILLLGWRYLSAPDRRSAILLVACGKQGSE